MPSPPAPKIRLPRIVGHCCFACGTKNPIGLGLTFFLQGDHVGCDLSLGTYHMGWENMAHGGIISTILDETMAYAVIALRRRFFVTKKMEISFRRPVPLDAPLTSRARVEARPHPKGCHTFGEIVNQRGDTLASAVAEMVFLKPARIARMPGRLQQDMRRFFDQMASVVDEPSSPGNDSGLETVRGSPPVAR